MLLSVAALILILCGLCEKAEGARDRAPESVPLKSLRRGRLRKTESVNTINMWGKLASQRSRLVAAPSPLSLSYGSPLAAVSPSSDYLTTRLPDYS